MTQGYIKIKEIILKASYFFEYFHYFIYLFILAEKTKTLFLIFV